eukprot:11809851-Ditylum_brightwellii.AAC.1
MGDYWSSHPCMSQHFVEEKEQGDKGNITEEDYATDELYLEHVVRDEKMTTKKRRRMKKIVML